MTRRIELQKAWRVVVPNMARAHIIDMCLDDMPGKEEQNGENDGDDSCSGSERDSEDANLDSSNESNEDKGSSTESPGIYNLAGYLSSPFV